ncbi:hypothetical protein SDC9_81828 [bioreactor metagenome]|uniref:Uncharacterized protein n=1 Tax=bioreactor metagenome TaxID=1076179 RepID=A0A644Z4P1_9ZZZZ
MQDDQNPADGDEPDGVHHRGPGAGVGLLHHDRAEWPQHVAGHPERRDAHGNGDDQQAGDDARDEVGCGEPDAAEKEPDQVQEGTHISIVPDRPAMHRECRGNPGESGATSH